MTSSHLLTSPKEATVAGALWRQHVAPLAICLMALEEDRTCEREVGTVAAEETGQNFSEGHHVVSRRTRPTLCDTKSAQSSRRLDTLSAPQRASGLEKRPWSPPTMAVHPTPPCHALPLACFLSP